MVTDPIDHATRYDISVDETGNMQVRKHYLTSFGQMHGGTQMAIVLMLIVKAAASFIGLVLAMWLGGTDLGLEVKASIFLGCIGLIAVFDLVILFLYIRFFRALLILGVLATLLIVTLELLS